MLRYLAALAWPAGLALILGAGYLLAGRAPAIATGNGGTAGRNGRRRSHRASRGSQLWAMVVGSVQIVVVAAVGSAIVFGVMFVLGQLVVYHGLAIDKPIWSWLQHHQVHVLTAVMKRLTKIGNTWTAWGAAGAAAVCLAVTWQTKRWIPPVLMATVIFFDHYTTIALRHTFHRLGPPTSPLGTYPSGGCDRIVVFYGLIAYLLWREFSGQRRTAMWAGAAVAALAFSEAYSRVYLGLHWFTDALSGVLYGVLLLIVFIAAVQIASGRMTVPFARRRVSSRAGAPASAAAESYVSGGRVA